MQRGAIEIASRLKKMAKKESQYYEGFVIGKIISPPPSIRIAIDEAIILDDSHLIVAASVNNKYEREVQYVQTNNTSTGRLKFTDTLKVGDEVILIPAGNGQIFVLLDRVEI